ncbi:MAG TPA: PEP-CTERM sorting domain-containing protein, partial [Bryobacteraceae bacterium]|nr:PEP-CTERM sorting domain-containing protein [Bryobacteraceae bacterium]
NNGTVELSGGSNLLVGPHGSSPVNFTNNWDGTNVGDCGCEGAIFGLLNSSSTVTGNLYNTSSALTQYEQYSSQVGLIGQSSLTVNGGFINDSSNGAGSSALTLDFGSTATVNGLLSNLGGSTVDLDFYSTEIPGTPGGSTLNANGGFLNSNSSVYLENGSTLNVSMPSQSLPTAAGPQTWAFQNASDDIASSENEALLQVGNPQFAPAYESQFNSSFNEGPGQAAPSVMNVTGGLLNSAVSTNDGAPWSFVNVDGGSTLNADTVSNVASVSGGTGLGSPEAKISVLNGSTMNVTGLLSNSADAAGGYAEAEVKVSGGSTLNAGSVLNQVTSSLGGDAEARIKVDGGIMNVGTTFTNTGGSVSVYNGGLLSIGTLAPGEGDNPPVATGVLTNTGRITTGWNGSTENTINVTGDIFNTSPGVINLKGNFDSMTATGQFTNSGTVSLSGAVQMVSAANITNQSGGVITVQGDSSTVAAVGTWSSDGQTQTSLGTFSNAGSVTIGQGAGVQADTFTQTGGQTAVEAGGSLTATNVNIDGGILSGGGTIYGDVKVDGGTLAPGDPQTIDIVGNYEQTLLGVLDLDFADGSNYDSVNVESDATHNGDVMLGGTLELTLENGFGAGVNIGDMFTILTWSGQLLPNVDDNNATNFDFLNLGTFNNGNQLLTFREVLGDNQLDLQVIDASVATPEPSTVAMMFGVLLLAGGVVWIRRRRAQRTVEAME